MILERPCQRFKVTSRADCFTVFGALWRFSSGECQQTCLEFFGAACTSDPCAPSFIETSGTDG